MANESIILELNAESDWDGVSATTLSRDDAVVTGQRYFKFNIVGLHGILPADLGGLFSATSVKLIGIAHNFRNPGAKARVIASDSNGSYRQEVTLRPDVQFITLFPGDKLAILTKDTQVQIVLVVNEMNEAESVRWGLAHEPTATPTRFRIIRQTGVAFAPALNNVWQPAFTFNQATGVMVVTDDSVGVIPSTSLCLFPRHEGCYVSLRYSASNADGKVHIVDNETRKSWIAEAALPDVRWSQVQYIGHDDNIALEATAAVAGQKMVCDIEVAPVQADSRLRARYQEGL
ncbi:MAG TPA: hypothetical protein VMY88_06515 [Acidimicrobiales bacterium]|nr:hypothetical protein [Acidimicrobiales bacterium]